ncbi:DUF397 domain-containing protein [Streptomyces zagrosensis]|uniref:DUF397 domain-containing protein n=1 Tax=Streptomyces zagrosensis TaxID=1042984 RepID=A0A7W9QJ12_9ACTN|nr:DUF397 domain-containing protein [Streptomyces zagrosensis]MBB5940137.1 hypothetical protein [Streptomyces zagrosensis]
MNTDLSSAKWHKSSYSSYQGDCVEVGTGLPNAVPVRDSKDPHGPALAFTAAAWSAFLAEVKAGEFGV